MALAASPSPAMVGGLTDPSEFSNPTSDYYGMDWNYVYQTRGGTSVAIGYFTLVTASHYSMNVGETTGDTFTVNGDVFRITSVSTLPADPGQGTKTPDLRVLHVKNLTNQYRPLPGFYDLYTGTLSTASSFTMVGTGDTGSTASPLYYTDTAGTRALRWGTNRYDSASPAYTFKDYLNITHSTQCFKMSYSRITGSNPTVYESGLGDGDSGGGIFVKDGDTWKLAGVGLYREYYSGSTDKYAAFYAASVPYYASKLDSLISHNLLPGDLNMDGNVDLADFITLKATFGTTVQPWHQGDFNGDGLIGDPEFYAFQANFGYTTHPGMAPSSGILPAGGPSVPEPASAILLALGGAALLRRRGGESKRRNP